MYVKDGIAYAGEPQQPIKISGVRPLDSHKLWIRFMNGEAKIFDFSGLLDSPAFSPLKNPHVFKDVYIDYGVTVWDNGNIDIAPEYLYENGIPAEGAPDG